MLYHVGDSQHTQNIQINKMIDENEWCVFYLAEKNRTFWPTQYMCEISRYQEVEILRQSIHAFKSLIEAVRWSS